MHAPMCPCCAGGRGGGGLGALLELPLMLAVAVLVLVARFVSGRVLHRAVGPWDARWSTWAPEVPAWVWAMGGVRPPRTRWARRPGWHRQVVRLAAVAVGLAVLAAPVVALSALAGAVLAAAVAVVARRRTAPTPDEVAAWADGEDWPASYLEDGGRGALPAPVHVSATRMDREWTHDGGDQAWVR